MLMAALSTYDNQNSPAGMFDANMTKAAAFRGKALDRRVLEPAADWLAVAVAVSLPWSTTATSILIILWLLAVLPTLDVAAVRRELLTAAGGLPVVLWALGGVGMFWADVTWSDRLAGYSSFYRFLAIPLLLAQFRRSEQGMRVLIGFFAAVTGVLLFSWLLVLSPALPWRPTQYGVPIKDYILQSGDFLICAFVLFALAFDNGRAHRRWLVIGIVALALLFLANIAFVATARTTLLVAPVLAILLGWRQFRWRGLLGAAIVFGILGGVAALEAPYLRTRLDTSLNELHAYETRDALNSTSVHLQFLKESLSFVATAPVIGHGTGTIQEQFHKAATGQTGPQGVASINPHDQILAVGIQLGLIGIAVLIAMWIAHFMLFPGKGLVAWIGIMIVAQNVVSSLVNSHLFDFTQAWLYIFGVGVTGGMALRERDRATAAQQAKRYEHNPPTA
jgi:O-antigen ligase